ncbi:MAG: hypothetical protein FJ319_08765 [SAR202 cluster bacterium]|nr:hypothetical protein [SAR202 cluster bacterium]
MPSDFVGTAVGAGLAGATVAVGATDGVGTAVGAGTGKQLCGLTATEVGAPDGAVVAVATDAAGTVVGVDDELAPESQATIPVSVASERTTGAKANFFR